jgi:regulatory protein
MLEENYPGVKEKLHRFCAYRERCESEVRKKLHLMGVDNDASGEFISLLYEEGWLNEKRFAESYVSGHLRKGWGAIKISHELRARGVAESVFKPMLEKLCMTENSDKLQQVAARKWSSLKTGTIFERKQKLYRFLTGRGFSGSEINAVMKNLK